MWGIVLSIRNGRRLGELCDDGQMIDAHTLAWLWTASNDAGNYVVLDDPAVRAS